MKVVLLQNIKGFGKIGEVKNVSDGYARNFLFPKKMAVMATDEMTKEIESIKIKRGEFDAKNKEAAQKAVVALENSTLEFEKKASNTGTLFSSLTKEEIAKELSKKAGGKVDPDMLDLGEHGEHIKHTGEHLITVHLTPELKAQVKIIIK